jgi:hypothetical protein
MKCEWANMTFPSMVTSVITKDTKKEKLYGK